MLPLAFCCINKTRYVITKLSYKFKEKTETCLNYLTGYLVYMNKTIFIGTGVIHK
jgi:hypothetical protein